MKLYTKTGDDGTTGLFGGRRVEKDDSRVSAYGDVDELNATLGVIVAACTDAALRDCLLAIQEDLFALGAELATPEAHAALARVDDERIAQLERWIDAATDEVPPMECFILPGGTATAAGLHLARTVCRRAERSLVSLARNQPIAPRTLIYLNRLSDLLFALARQANHRAGVADVPWKPTHQRS